MHLVITNANESYIKVQCDEAVAWELRDAFSFRPPRSEEHTSELQSH